MKELWVYLVNKLDELVPSIFLGFAMLCLVGLTVKGQPVFFGSSRKSGERSLDF